MVLGKHKKRTEKVPAALCCRENESGATVGCMKNRPSKHFGKAVAVVFKYHVNE
jgi:hypothetical protein